LHIRAWRDDRTFLREWTLRAGFRAATLFTGAAIADEVRITAAIALLPWISSQNSDRLLS